MRQRRAKEQRHDDARRDDGHDENDRRQRERGRLHEIPHHVARGTEEPARPTDQAPDEAHLQCVFVGNPLSLHELENVAQRIEERRQDRQRNRSPDLRRYGPQYDPVRRLA
jgi:hypothetical protein